MCYKTLGEPQGRLGKKYGKRLQTLHLKRRNMAPYLVRWTEIWREIWRQIWRVSLLRLWALGNVPLSSLFVPPTSASSHIIGIDTAKTPITPRRRHDSAETTPQAAKTARNNNADSNKNPTARTMAGRGLLWSSKQRSRT